MGNLVRVLVVYESMYGNTHAIAAAIGRGLAESGVDVSVVPVQEAIADRVAGSDLVVVGGPTHAHGMSRDKTRQAAVADAAEPGSSVYLDPDAAGEGLRDWFDGLPEMHAAAAAFDTRFAMASAITGRASKGISRRLRRLGFREVVDPESFFVERGNTLEPGEEQRAVDWGRRLGAVVGRSSASGASLTGEPS